ncbi:hypothetical protein [Halodesulfovibrio spirochaetisodalis]|uniref:hypothetical protein n=1 Tax=Halodesulfovibrio spirochaetisodalis TaxID=1560234 RepID=UPI0012F8ECF6|nr:hypothetical protein [Halodesulfovibrio spirochaetisodalis]
MGLLPLRSSDGAYQLGVVDGASRGKGLCPCIPQGYLNPIDPASIQYLWLWKPSR